MLEFIVSTCPDNELAFAKQMEERYNMVEEEYVVEDTLFIKALNFFKSVFISSKFKTAWIEFIPK